MSPKELRRQITERKSPEKGFAGREALVDALYESETPASSGVINQRILAANIIKESVIALVNAVKAKNALETLVTSEAERILAGRAEKSAVKKIVRREHDLSTPEGLASAALESMNVSAQVRVRDRRTGASGTYSILAITTEKGEERAMLHESVLSAAEPVAAAREYLEKQGFAKPPPSSNGERVRGRRAADLVELERDDLDRRKIAFQGSEGNLPNHFTYLEEGMETTITARPDLKGQELLSFLEARIIQLHSSTGRRFSSDVAEVLTADFVGPMGISKMQDAALGKVSHAIFTLANSFDENLVPEEYADAVERVKNSREFQEFCRYFNEGLFTNEEIRDFRTSFDRIDHPGHLLVRQMHAQMIDQNGDISDIDREALKLTLSTYEGKVDMPDAALRALAEAYSMISREDATQWDPETVKQKYFVIMTSIRMSVKNLSAGFRVVKDDQAAEERFDSDPDP